MDLSAITDLDGGRLQSANPLGERYHVLRDKNSDVEHGPTQGSDLSDTDGEDEAEVPFIPPHASLDPRTHFLSDPYKARLASPSGVYAASSAARNPAYPTYRLHSDRDSDCGTSPSPISSPQMARRRARPDDDDFKSEGGRAEDRERYRPRPRYTGVERDISLKHSHSHPPPLPKLTPRRPSPSFERSPDSDTASSKPPQQAELASDSNHGRYLGSDYTRVQPQRCNEATAPQLLPTRGEYHPSGTLVHPQISAHGWDNARSSSVESIEDWVKSPTPPPAPPQPVQKRTTVPPLSPMSASVSTPASVPAQAVHDAGSLGMLSDSELADETVHLRALLGCPPGAPVGLDALADPPPGEKPNYPLPTLIKLAIYGSPRGRLTLQEIYQALEDRFEWFRQRTDELSWKNSIRHNLSLRKCFLKVQRPITEPGKGSYWMIDLTQGEGNKRVRKRNKKPTKGQLAAQAAAEAYRASARLPGQGEGLRPAPYPPSSHLHTRSQVIVEEDSGDDDQAPPVRTNFTTTTPIEGPHPCEFQNSALYHQPSTSSDRALLSLRPNSARPHSPSHSILGHDANIDPTLRVSPNDALSPHEIPALIAALHQEIPPQRSLSPSGIQPGAIHVPIPVNVLPIGAGPLPRGQSIADTPQIQQQAFANPQAQVIFTVPRHPPYNNSPSLSHSGSGPQPPQAVSAFQVPQDPQSLLRQHFQSLTTPPQPPNVQHQVVAVPQTAPAQGHHTPRLPPMRTLSESPAPSTPSVPLPQQQQQQQSPSSSSSDCAPQPPPQRQQQQNPVVGFGRYAHAPAGFSKPNFGKPAMPVAPLILPGRALPLSDKGVSRVDSQAAGDDERRGRRRFIPPLPRPGIEYVHRADGGLVTARRTSERYDERTVDWINRLDGNEES